MHERLTIGHPARATGAKVGTIRCDERVGWRFAPARKLAALMARRRAVTSLIGQGDPGPAGQRWIVAAMSGKAG